MEKSDSLLKFLSCKDCLKELEVKEDMGYAIILQCPVCKSFCTIFKKEN